MARFILFCLLLLPSLYGNAGTHQPLIKWSMGYSSTSVMHSNPQIACKQAAESSTAWQHDVYEYQGCVQTQPWEYKTKIRHKSTGAILYPDAIAMYKWCSSVITSSNPERIDSALKYSTSNTCSDSCNAPQVFNYDSNSCNNPCVDGVLLDAGTYEPRATALAPIACVNSCEGMFVGGQPFISCSIGSGGVGQCSYYQTGKYISTGKDCYGNTTQMASKSTPPRPENCPECDCLQQGKSYGTVNGATVCTGTSNAETKNSEGTTSTDKDGVKSTTIKDVQLNPDGTVKTTTTTTTENSDGTKSTSASSSSQSLGSFCSQYPADKLCKSSSSTSSGSGSGDYEDKDDIQMWCDKNPDSVLCQTYTDKMVSVTCNQNGSVNFTCDGDNHACQQLKQQAQTDCKLLMQDQSMIDDFSELDSEQQGMGDPENYNLPTQLSTGSGLSDACPPDVHVNVLGADFHLPYSQMCPYLRAVGYIMLAMAYLAAAKIIASGV